MTITITGVNDAPVVGTAITNKTGTINQPIAEINLGDAFTDVDENDTLTLALMVTLDGNAVILTTNGTTMTLGTTGLTYNTETHILSGNPSATGTYKIKIVATDGAGESSAETEFDIVITPETISGDDTGSVTDGGAPGDDNTGTLMAPGNTITLVSKETTDSPGMSTGTYGTMAFDGTTWTYTLDDRVEVLADGQTATESFTFSAGGGTFVVTITVVGVNDAPTVSGEFFTRVGAAGRPFTLTNLSDQFTDVDEGDELTFEVTLDDGAALSTIGLTYNSDDDEITGQLTEVGTYVIKIVATDKIGETVEATFDLNISVLIIQRNSLTYNPDATSITIDETMLKVTSGNESDPTLLEYTITTLPDAGRLLKSGTPLNSGDTFTQADINNGLITYEPSVSDPSTSQSNPLSFTISDGVATLEDQTLEITSREVFEDADADAAEDNTIDQSSETTPLKIEAGDGSDIITGGTSDDQIDGGAGDDEIILTRTVNNVEEDAGADEVLYEFGYDGVGIDGGDEIVGFQRGQDKLTFVVDRNFNSLTEFLQSLNGADDEDLTADDAFVVTMQWGTDEAGAFYFDGVLLHFKDVSVFGGGRVSSPLVQITFDERLDLDNLVEILGGAGNTDNFDFTHAAFENLDEVLPRLFGEGSIGFKGPDSSGTNGASERASEEPQPPIYETLSEQLDDPVTVTKVNDAPTLVDAGTATRGVAVNKAVTDITQAYLLSLFNDIDGDALSLTVSSLGSIGLSYNSTDGITGTPTNSGLYTVKVVATDGNGGSAEKILKIAVGEVVTEDDAGARFTGTTTGNISSVNLTFGSFELSSGRWTYTLNSAKAQRLKAGEQKTDIITFSDGTAVIVTILGRNDAPVVDTAIESQSGVEGQEKVIDLSNLFSDIDTKDTLTLSVTVELDGNEIVFDGSRNIISDLSASKELRITLANTGTYRVTAVADDGNGGTVESTFDIVVSAQAASPSSSSSSSGAPPDPSNNIPTLTGNNLDAIFVKGVARTVDLSGSFDDADAGDTLTFSSSNLPTGFTLDSATGVLSSTPETVGLFEDIVVTASDGKSGGTVDYTFDISVSIAEDPDYYFTWTPTGTDVGGVTIKKGSLDRYNVSDDAFSPTPDDTNDILSGDNVVRLVSTFTDDADGETISLGGGSDLYRVEAGFQADVIIDDRSGIEGASNVIQFLSDVTINGYEVVEVNIILGDESATLRSLYLQIDTDATAAENLVLLKIETPKTQFYQVGAATDTLLTYDDFLATLFEIDIPNVGSDVV